MVKQLSMKRKADNATCPGCNRSFVLNQHLQSHLGKALYGKWKRGILTASMCAGRSQCQKTIARRIGGTRLRQDTLKRSRIRTVVCVRRKPSGSVTFLHAGCGGKSVPAFSGDDVSKHESEGIDAVRVASGIETVKELTCVKKYVSKETAGERKVLYRFMFFVLYSLAALVSFTARKLFFSESTLAIAIGDLGMMRLDDVCCFQVLYESLARTFVRETERVLWIMVAHMIVRPGLIEHLRNLVCSQCIYPTEQNIGRVISVLARRLGSF